MTSRSRTFDALELETEHTAGQTDRERSFEVPEGAACHFCGVQLEFGPHYTSDYKGGW